MAKQDQDDIARGRRRFLQQSLALIPLTATAGSGIVSFSTQAETRVSPAGNAVADYIPQWFNREEWRFVCAACDRLIPQDALGPGALSEGVPVFIDKQMELPYGHGLLWYMQPPFYDGIAQLGYQSSLVPRQSWRLGIAAVNHYCQQQHHADFADLTAGQQDEILHLLEDGKLNFPDLPGALFFTQMLENTKEGYFADPLHGGNQTMASWQLIGFPGARADFTEVMDEPNQRYTLPPVSISGRRGELK